MITTTSLRRAGPTASSGYSRVAAVAVAILAIGWWSTGPARAGVSSFALSPMSGPPGTVVSVDGRGCSPGLTLSPSSDFVAVAAPTLDQTMQVPVAANGSWHAGFTIPPGANAGPAPVAAVCVSDAIPSLTTVYSPRTFTVTTVSPPTTTTPTTTPGGTTPGGTTPKGGSGGSTPTTRGEPPDAGGGSSPRSTVPTVEGLPAGGSNGGPSSGGTSAGPGAAPDNAGVPRVTHRAAAAALAANLSAPELSAARIGDAGELGWLVWSLLIALVVAAVAAPICLRRFRRRDTDVAAIGDLS